MFIREVEIQDSDICKNQKFATVDFVLITSFHLYDILYEKIFKIENIKNNRCLATHS